MVRFVADCFEAAHSVATGGAVAGLGAPGAAAASPPTAPQHRAELGAEPRAHQAVDQKVGGGVHHQGNLGYESKDKRPDGEASEVGEETAVDLVDHGDLMHVEAEAREVAEDEDGNDDEQHHTEAVFPPTPPLPSSSDCNVDPTVGVIQ